MNEMGKFCGVSDEKYRGVVQHPVKVSFFGLDLEGEALDTDFRRIVS